MHTILLVEDNVELADAIVRDLRGQGFQVVHVTGGEAALRESATHSYDALVLDWMLPDLDGLAVLRRLQEAGHTIPVLMLTARADEMDRVIGLEVGADDYLTKPFSMRELVARLHALLRRVERTKQLFASDRKTQGETLCWEAITLEPQTHRAWVDGQVVELTPIEFSLLALFLRNPGRVFNRAYLLETIWEQDHIPGDRSVDNAVVRLRKKITPYGEAIEAVWGVGYRLRGRE